jgi:hypothetical protein
MAVTTKQDTAYTNTVLDDTSILDNFRFITGEPGDRNLLQELMFSPMVGEKGREAWDFLKKPHFYDMLMGATGGEWQNVYDAWTAPEPERVDISDNYWSDLATNTDKQRELLQSRAHWRRKDLEAQQPSIMDELVKMFSQENRAFVNPYKP